MIQTTQMMTSRDETRCTYLNAISKMLHLNQQTGFRPSIGTGFGPTYIEFNTGANGNEGPSETRFDLANGIRLQALVIGEDDSLVFKPEYTDTGVLTASLPERTINTEGKHGTWGQIENFVQDVVVSWLFDGKEKKLLKTQKESLTIVILHHMCTKMKEGTDSLFYKEDGEPTLLLLLHVPVLKMRRAIGLREVNVPYIRLSLRQVIRLGLRMGEVRECMVQYAQYQVALTAYLFATLYTCLFKEFKK